MQPSEKDDSLHGPRDSRALSQSGPIRRLTRSERLRRSQFLGATFAMLMLPGLASAQEQPDEQGKDRPKVVVSDEALEVHSKTFVFDGHNDLPWQMREKAAMSFSNLDIAKPQPQLHTDIERLHKGNVGAQFWSVYVPASTMKNGSSLSMTLEQIEIVKAMCEKYPETFQMAYTYDDIVAAREAGKIASLIGVEGGHSIENSIQNLRRLHELGARYMTLTHSDTLEWADSATDDQPHGGLTEFGEEIVREMNRLGMLVDLSHVSPDTMKDALRVSKAPIIYSHSSARGVADHPRNVPDDILPLVKENGGVVMVNFYSGFVEPTSAKRSLDMFEVRRQINEKYSDPDERRQAMERHRRENPILPGSVHDVVDHIDRLVKFGGIDHVGIGSDYDGIGMLPDQLEDVSTYPVITQELLNRGYSAEDIHKIMSGNIMRVYKEAEAVSKKLRNEE